MYKILTHDRLKMLRTTIEGFLTLEELGIFAREAQQAVAAMGCSSGDWVHCCDITKLTLQSRDVAEAVGQFINHPERRSRRLAIVVGSSPARMQARRLLTRCDAAIFENMREAEAWLIGSFDHRMSA